MEKFPFSNVLFMSNFTIDMGDPNFRTGAYLKYLEPIANTLSKKNILDIRFLIGKHTFESIIRASQTSNIKHDNSFIIDYQRDMQLFGIGDFFIRKSYNNSFSEGEQSTFTDYFETLFMGWKPNLIICWEFPTTFFRALFPDALVIDLMPGLFMRPPYPRTISFDPVGLYKDSCFGVQSLKDVKATEAELAAYYKIRNNFERFFAESSAKNLILSKLKDINRFSTFTLVPLQISQYFGFYENCKYKSQFDFLVDVLNHTPEDTGVIATQYVSSFVQEKAINDKNIDFLTSNFSNFLYSKDFERIDNISQFIVPWADTTCSISSTIGLQAKFYNRRLISPSKSHLAFIADQTDFEESGYNDQSNNENVMALMMNRQTFLESRLLEDPDYLSSILTEIYRNRINGRTGLELLPSKQILETVNENPLHYIVSSSQEAAARQMAKLGHTGVQFANNELNLLLDAMKNASVISFDIFDTLLCRSVFKPEDVFLIMQKEFASGDCQIKLPFHIAKSFVQLRTGAERQLRRERDEQISSNEYGESYTEEITIREVYTLLVERFGGSFEDIDKLIQYEQETENNVLQARPVGQFLFKEAIKSGKPVIIVSDFIHDEKFVAAALSNAGFSGYSKLYLSSTIGKKKHSGDLFQYIAEDINIDPSGILHIGDNPIGDLEQAQAAGWQSIRISSARERALEIVKDRKLSPAILSNSFILRTALSLFSERYYQAKVTAGHQAAKTTAKERGFVENGEEFGFIALGPLMLAFSEWVIQQAKKKNCDSIVFFARDCYLPYKITEKILQKRGESDELKIHYIATSRRGLMGLNSYSPEDFLTVRIDDYSKSNSFSMLLERRFGIDPNTISEAILSYWGVDDITVPVGKITPAAIYGIVYQHVKANWTGISNQLEEKRTSYKKYLLQEGVDLFKSTLAVDFGYKGSTHRMIEGMFKGDFYPAFFMTYADDFGQDPISNAESFYLKNINPINRTSTLLSHNLIIETLVNEPTGSLLEVYSNENSELKLLKEEIGSVEHLAKVSAVHRGVLSFLDSWLQYFGTKPNFASLELNSAEYVLTSILRKPMKLEAESLRGMLFDNAFAGHNNRYIVVPYEGAKDTESIWKEGHAALYPNNNKEKVNVDKKNPKPAVQIPKVVVNNDSITVDGTKYDKNINSLRILHRDTFIESVSLLAKYAPTKDEKSNYAKMIKDHSKKYVAAKLFKEHGGISHAQLPGSEKFKAYWSLLLKK